VLCSARLSTLGAELTFGSVASSYTARR